MLWLSWGWGMEQGILMLVCQGLGILLFTRRERKHTLRHSQSGNLEQRLSPKELKRVRFQGNGRLEKACPQAGKFLFGLRFGMWSKIDA